MTIPFPLATEVGQQRRFDPTGDSTNGWQTYTIPTGARFLMITALGGGGKGGNGFTGAAGTARGGGGGGGSGSISTGLFPTACLSGVLHIFVGRGGITGNGSGTYVCFVPRTTASAVLVAGYGGNAGGNGTATAGGTGGAAGTLAITTFGSLGLFQSYAGQAGTAGGAHTGANAASVTFGAVANLRVSSGAGGGGCTSADFSGGAITGSELCPTIPGGTAALPAGGFGFESRFPDLSCGGSGGAALNSGLGGIGGQGARGSGGGGGGAGTTGGTGGNGGNGLVLITALH